MAMLVLRPGVDAAGGDLGFTGSLAAFPGLALVDRAGKPIDQPRRFVGGLSKPA